MEKRRQYTSKEKLKYTKEFIEKGYSYGEMTAKRAIPKTTMQRWVVLYEKEGEKAFTMNHGSHSKKNGVEVEPQFILKEKNDIQEELELLRAENAYLKNLRALVQERQKREKKS